MEVSPHEYNDTFAHMLYPMEKDTILARSIKWMDGKQDEYKTTVSSDQLPDHIRNVEDSILQEVIQCHTCARGFRITPQELAFLRQHNFPLPRRCPFCRIEEKVRGWARQMVLVERKCDHCGKLFRTNYRKEDAPMVYCKECYYHEILA